MRFGLKQFYKKKITATATFIRYGNSYNSGIRTNKRWDDKSFRLLFRDVTIKEDDKEICIGHMWFKHSKGFKRLGLLERGDRVLIYGEVRKYTKKANGIMVEDFELVPIEIEEIPQIETNK